MRPEEELTRYDKEKCWPAVYQRLRIESLKKHDYSLKDARRPEFRNRNRYGDVSPYDDTRVHLLRNDIDYINASAVKAESANRTYLLTQGPLPDTSGHFWLMMWEQGSRAVLMLNRIIEKDQIKCHQYYPTGRVNGGVDEMIFSDVGLSVTFVEEQHANYHYTTRTLHLHDSQSDETREVTQFHYTAWPDFGVPESPDAFLDFLFAVRKSGVLDDPNRPPVIHCSAGIGRSGTFCLVDTCLVLIEQQGCTDNINVLELLMDMRRYRMGLIQTPDQLRFSYLAVVAGTRRISNGVPGGTDEAKAEELDDRESVNTSINNSSESQRIDKWISSYSKEINDSDHEEEENGDLPPDIPPRLPPRHQQAYPSTSSIEGQVEVSGHNGNTSYVSRESNVNNSSVQNTSAAAAAAGQTAAAAEQSNTEEGRDSKESVKFGTQRDPSPSRAAAAGLDPVYSPEDEKEREKHEQDEEKEREKHEQDEEKEIRRRRRDDRVKNTADQIERMRRRQRESELAQQRNRAYAPYAYAGLAVMVAVGSYVLYRTLGSA